MVPGFKSREFTATHRLMAALSESKQSQHLGPHQRLKTLCMHIANANEKKPVVNAYDKVHYSWQLIQSVISSFQKPN